MQYWTFEAETLKDVNRYFRAFYGFLLGRPKFGLRRGAVSELQGSFLGCPCTWFRLHGDHGAYPARCLFRYAACFPYYFFLRPGRLSSIPASSTSLDADFERWYSTSPASSGSAGPVYITATSASALARSWPKPDSDVSFR
jgi:hypothetical protein